VLKSANNTNPVGMVLCRLGVVRGTIIELDELRAVISEVRGRLKPIQKNLIE